jgi:hypothetical protein
VTESDLKHAGRFDLRTLGMKLIALFAALGAVVAGAGTAHAQRWDSTGWVKLGEREVNGRVDHLPGGGRAKVQVWAK